jgi:hypothetical protein
VVGKETCDSGSLNIVIDGYDSLSLISWISLFAFFVC